MSQYKYFVKEKKILKTALMVLHFWFYCVLHVGSDTALTPFTHTRPNVVTYNIYCGKLTAYIMVSTDMLMSWC